MPAHSPSASSIPSNYPASQSTIVDQAAKAHGIPPWILQGVWGTETNFGKDTNTSSAGAVGDFQFIPSTAAQYNYPLTNSPDAGQFAQQADAAARLLSDLYHQKGGSWDQAISAYNAGPAGAYQSGYVAKVHQLGNSAPGHASTGPNLGAIPGAIGNAVNTVTGAASSVGDLVGMLTSTVFWLRLFEGIAGIILLALGLKALTGMEIPNPAAAVAKVAA